MIVFVDLRASNIVGHRFAFWDTVRDRFVELGNEMAWLEWDDFLASYADDLTFDSSSAFYSGEPFPVERFKSLCHGWVFVKVEDAP